VRANRYGAVIFKLQGPVEGEVKVSIRFYSIAAVLAFGAAPALATAAAAPAAAPAPAAKPAAQPQNRATLAKNLDANFKAIDTNGDGSLNAAELTAAEGKVQQQRIAALRARFEADFTKLDTNKDGVLSKAEFMVAAPQTSASPPNGAAIVAQLDKNKDGKVTADEYRGPVLGRFDQVDTNHDGVLSDAEKKAAAARK
jgi:Ca2+-binding EF-hand superfamily protein